SDAPFRDRARGGRQVDAFCLRNILHREFGDTPVDTQGKEVMNQAGRSVAPGAPHPHEMAGKLGVVQQPGILQLLNAVLDGPRIVTTVPQPAREILNGTRARGEQSQSHPPRALDPRRMEHLLLLLRRQLDAYFELERLENL